MDRYASSTAALALSALALCAPLAAAQTGQVPDTVGNFAVFRNPAPYFIENRDEAIVASSDADRMSAVMWACRGTRTRVSVTLDRLHGFTRPTAKLVYRFDRGRK